MTPDSFQDHLSNQESILQSTRGLHYVFQAIFLGIGFAILAIGYSLSISIDMNKNQWKNEITAITFIIIACLLIIYFGLRFLKDYSENVYKRGVVIDVLQHLRVLNYKGKLAHFLEELLEKPKDDILFILIKIVERIASEYGGPYRDPKLVASVIGLKIAPYPDIVAFKRFDLFVFITFYGDIYIAEHPQQPIDWHAILARKISETRDGHKKSFRIVWTVLIVLLALLVIFTLVKIAPNG